MALSRTLSGEEFPSGYADHPQHKIIIEPEVETVIVEAAGRQIAESSRALLLKEADYAPVLYIPRDDVAMSALGPIEDTTWCPFKGRASYFALQGRGQEKLAWSYEDPFEEVGAIKDHLAFYPSVATLKIKVG